MPFNKFLVEEKNTILQGKLEKLASKLTTGGAFETKEEVIGEVIRVLESFYKDLNEPIFTPEVVMEGDNPDPELYNRIWNQLIDDLAIIFAELENLEDLTIENFNFITTEHGRLLARLKNVSSALGDYILYSSNPTRDAFYFKDSFNDLSRIDANSQLLNKPQCEVDQDQGIVLLPVNKDKDSSIKITAEPVINTNSNGFVGNNQQINAAFNGDPKKVLDNNPDTWFEYEKVVTKADDTSEPLTLDMTINLGAEQIVNYIRINPNNFGTKTTIIVDRIETSLDGKSYTNVKDDIPIGDFLTKDEDNVFILAPSTSKYAGQGIYSFTPRKAKYVHFVFKQNEPYVIKTTQGEKLRYAIGIRDIDIRGVQYLPEGEVVSKPFEFVTEEEIRKVAIDANQDPTEESTLASISYFISPDNGQTWNAIRPKSFEGFANQQSTVPEILDFNGSIEGTIKTTVPVASLRLKAVLKREDAAFTDGVSSFRKEVKSRSELHRVPEEAPFEVTLEQPPVDGTLEIIDPQFGSRGRPDYQYVISNGSFQKQSYYLPFTTFKPANKKVLSGGVYTLQVAPASEWMHIEVGGEEWLSATQPVTAHSDPQQRVYTFNHKTGLLQFGNGSNTMAPPLNAPITMYLDAERLYPSETTDSHIALLDFKTSNDKEQFTLKRYEEELDANQLIPKKASVVHLEHENITDLGTITSVLNTLGYSTRKTYVNGRDELTAANTWSIDTDKGIVYLGAETSASSNYTVDYKYRDVVTLSASDWDWASGASLRDSIKIKETAFKTIHVDDFSLPTTQGIYVLDLPHLAIVKGTVEFELLDGGNTMSDKELDPFLKEVPYIDGLKEFGSTIQRTVERVPALDAGSNGVAKVTLTHPIVNDTAYTLTFTNKSIFVAQDPALNDVGDWNVDRTYGSPTYKTVSVKRAGPADDVAFTRTGWVYYWYLLPATVTQGLYSIDYKNGRIFLQRPMQGGTWTLTASYQYTDYRAEYNIARVLPAASYVVNKTDNVVKIKDNEVLYRGNLPRAKLHEQNPYYQFTYDYVAVSRENVADLKDYFSPVLKDYVLKVITKGQLI